METIGERIKELRKRKGMSQAELGEVIKLTYSAVSSIESGRSDINSETILKLKNFFGVSLEYLLTGSETAETISTEEHEIIEMYRKDQQLKEAFEMIRNGKKKVINKLVTYMQPQPTLYEVREPAPTYNLSNKK